jgi:hypothetical protein
MCSRSAIQARLIVVSARNRPAAHVETRETSIKPKTMAEAKRTIPTFVLVPGEAQAIFRGFWAWGRGHAGLCALMTTIKRAEFVKNFTNSLASRSPTP